jgi:hypothetical protein
MAMPIPIPMPMLMLMLIGWSLVTSTSTVMAAFVVETEWDGVALSRLRFFGGE